MTNRVKGWDAFRVLELAIERERGGHQFYLKAAQGTRNEGAQRMFHWLAGEELKHLEKLGQAKEELARTGEWRVGAAGLEPLARGDFPSLSEAGGDVRPDASELEALRMGIQGERDSIALYRQAAQETTYPQAREMFLKLVEVEEGHLELLEEEYRWLKMGRPYFTPHRFHLPPG